MSRRSLISQEEERVLRFQDTVSHALDNTSKAAAYELSQALICDDAIVPDLETDWMTIVVPQLLRTTITVRSKQDQVLVTRSVLTFLAKLPFKQIKIALTRSNGSWLDDVSAATYSMISIMRKLTEDASCSELQQETLAMKAKALSLLAYVQPHDASIQHPLQQTYFLEQLHSFVLGGNECASACAQLLAIAYCDKERRGHFRFDICELMSSNIEIVSKLDLVARCGQQLSSVQNRSQLIEAIDSVMSSVRMSVISEPVYKVVFVQKVYTVLTTLQKFPWLSSKHILSTDCRYPLSRTSQPGLDCDRVLKNHYMLRGRLGESAQNTTTCRQDRKRYEITNMKVVPCFASRNFRDLDWAARLKSNTGFDGLDGLQEQLESVQRALENNANPLGAKFDPMILSPGFVFDGDRLLFCHPA